MPSCNVATSSDDRTTRLPGARGEQHGAESQEVPFGIAVEASALCEMEEALRVRIAFQRQSTSHACAPVRPKPSVFPSVSFVSHSP